MINCVASQHDLWSIFTSTQAMIILWPILTAHHRRCCPLCDFLLPPLHDHRKCRSLISGPKVSVKSKNNEFLTYCVEAGIGNDQLSGAYSRSLWLPGRGEHCCEASDARPRACQVSAVGKQFSKEMTPEMFQNSPGQDHQSTHSSLCIWAHFHPLGPGSGRGFLLHNVRDWTYRVLGLP